MKRAIQLLLILFVIVNFLVATPKIFAQEQASESSGVASAPASVDYTLQYPGILPDNPLYILKAIRDRVVSLLISDTQKKAEFNLLTSDKRVSAALMLANRGKAELAVSTLSKSNNYLEESIAEVEALSKSKTNINPLIDTLKNAIRKHQDLAVGIKSRVGKKFEKQAEVEAKKLEKFAKRVGNIRRK